MRQRGIRHRVFGWGEPAAELAEVEPESAAFLARRRIRVTRPLASV